MNPIFAMLGTSEIVIIAVSFGFPALLVTGLIVFMLSRKSVVAPARLGDIERRLQTLEQAVADIRGAKGS